MFSHFFLKRASRPRIKQAAVNRRVAAVKHDTSYYYNKLRLAIETNRPQLPIEPQLLQTPCVHDILYVQCKRRRIRSSRCPAQALTCATYTQINAHVCITYMYDRCAQANLASHLSPWLPSNSCSLIKSGAQMQINAPILDTSLHHAQNLAAQ
jgi:hypothetical protein